MHRWGWRGDLLYEMASYVLSRTGWRRLGAGPRAFTQDLLRAASFAYPVELPFGEVSGVEVREDHLVLTGEVEDLPIG